MRVSIEINMISDEGDSDLAIQVHGLPTSTSVYVKLVRPVVMN